MREKEKEIMDLFKSLRNRKRRPLRQNHLGMLRNRKIALTGDFFPLDKLTFEAKLNHLKGEVQLELTSETDVLICGKYPDRKLISEAEKNGTYTIFIDKVSDLFALRQADSQAT